MLPGSGPKLTYEFTNFPVINNRRIMKNEVDNGYIQK